MIVKFLLITLYKTSQIYSISNNLATIIPFFREATLPTAYILYI